jgi:hypothetical protein
MEVEEEPMSPVEIECQAEPRYGREAGLMFARYLPPDADTCR